MSRASLVILVLFGLIFPSLAQEPWTEPQDTAEAVLKPDSYAWRLFVSLNWPADIPNRMADPAASFGADGPVAWETWRNVNNFDAMTVFRLDGSDPGPWLDEGAVPAGPASIRSLNALDPEAIQQQILSHNAPEPFFDEGASPAGFNETRVNREAYEFIRAEELYNLEGQVALALAETPTISFPVHAKEIKAQWRLISSEDRSRYHWTSLTQGATTTYYGLTALHITTKDIPNWFWATFEHVDNKLSEEAGGRPGNEGWLLPSKDAFACPLPPYDCEGIPSGIGLEGTIWENYRLRGTQIDFIDSRGEPTILANSQPEQFFQTTSSCMSCHARSTIDATGERLPIFTPDDLGYIGSPDPAWFGDDQFSQLDFVWSLMRARPKAVP